MKSRPTSLPTMRGRQSLVDPLIASEPLYRGSEWDFETLQSVYSAVERIAHDELKLDTYRNQIEVITAEQMLDCYASTGMPSMYSHWSFGKHFAREELLYRKGAQTLAYELVINSDPCVNYIMEENTMTMQTLVIAHAAFGHNHFFKNNYLFKQWTRADRVLDDLNYAKSYITHCEEKFGYRRVEQLLDSAHALMSHAVDRYAPIHRDRKSQRQKAEDRARYEEQHFNDLWRTVPTTSDRDSADDPKVPKLNLVLPADNVLKFVALHSPRLEPWQREILKIVCRNAQYFYPQRQTKVMNEGCATFVHYTIMNRMYDLGLIDEGSMLEFLRSHSSVIQQAGFDHRAFHGFNPYALGFAMMRDIERICVDPDDEDHHWFPDIAGCGEAWAVLRNAWAEYRDESFILQFLSPRLIREMHLFAVSDRGEMPFLRVNAIHDEVGYRDIRSQLASMYDLSNQTPQIEVRGADLEGNRRLLLVHRGRDGKRLNSETAGRVLNHLAFLWGYGVRLDEEDSEGRFLEKHEAFPMPTDG